MKIFQKKNIPNFLSLFRILLIPLYVFLFIRFFPDRLWYSAVVFIVAGLTDLLDGYLARKNGWVSNIGKLLDPLADKLIEVAALLLLATQYGGGFIALAIVALLKELLMILGAYVIVTKAKVYVMSMWFGKVTTFILYLEVLAVSFFSGVLDQKTCDIMSLVVILCMFVTFILYYISYRRSLRVALNLDPAEEDKKTNCEENNDRKEEANTGKGTVAEEK